MKDRQLDVYTESILAEIKREIEDRRQQHVATDVIIMPREVFNRIDHSVEELDERINSENDLAGHLFGLDLYLADTIDHIIVGYADMWLHRIYGLRY